MEYRRHDVNEMYFIEILAGICKNIIKAYFKQILGNKYLRA